MFYAQDALPSLWVLKIARDKIVDVEPSIASAINLVISGR